MFGKLQKGCLAANQTHSPMPMKKPIRSEWSVKACRAVVVASGTRKNNQKGNLGSDVRMVEVHELRACESTGWHEKS